MTQWLTRWGSLFESESVRSRFSRCLSLIEIDSHNLWVLLEPLGELLLKLLELLRTSGSRIRGIADD